MTEFDRKLGRAFTLVELLVVLAIVALLIGLIVPAIAESRSAAQTTRSLANLRSHSQTALTYANDHLEQFPNPFPVTNDPTIGLRSNQDWVWVPGREGIDGWSYGESAGGGSRGEASGTEAFGYHWLAHVRYADHESGFPDTLVAPGDRPLSAWLKVNRDPNRRPSKSWIPPTSYWYPPVFWQSPDRFKDFGMRPARPSNNYYIRRNRVSECALPSKKVFFFENRDYQSPNQPMWNAALARTNVAFVDGSTSRVKMATIFAHTTTSPLGEPGKLDLPSGKWQPLLDEMEMRFFYGARQGFDWRAGRPAFFWRTRYGIRGRDVP